MPLRDFERLPAFARRMGAAEEGERFVVETLQTEREAVDAGRREVGEARRLDRIGVGFERDLDVLGRRPMPRAASIRAATVAGSISDGVPPPKKIEVRVRPGSSRASWARSASSASRHASWSISRGRGC